MNNWNIFIGDKMWETKSSIVDFSGISKTFFPYKSFK